MSPEIEQRVEFLKQIPLFVELSDDAITQIKKRLTERPLAKGESVFSQGDVADNFYIVLKGHVKVRQIKGQKSEDLGIFEAGDHFGEDGLLYKRRRSASIDAVEASTLLYLDEQDFLWLVRTYPSVKPYLAAIADTHRRARRLNFDWLIEGEIIYLINRRHVFQMLSGLIVPFGIMIISFGLLFYNQLTTGTAPHSIAVIFGCLLLIFAIPWGLWAFMDWRNDYFIVTSHRVVWLERVLLHSDTRQESPIAAIQSANVDTGFWGRILHYGDVAVRHYTGSIVMTSVVTPYQMSELIERLIKRVRGKTQQAKLDAMNRTIRQNLGHDIDEEKQIETPQRVIFQPNQESQKRRYRPFRMREVDGDVITYHKHWYVLLSKITLPLLGVLVVLTIGRLSSMSFWLIGPPLIILFGICWYRYADWNNDIYQLTKDKIIDRDKKPLGKESVQSAPLINVLSVEQGRKNLLRIILNIGTVKTYVGDITFTFVEVHNPAQVSQDIFNYRDALKQEGAEKEAEREREQMGEWIHAYHKILSEEENSPESEPEFDMN